MRKFPPDVVSALPRAVELERLALASGGVLQHQRAKRATDILMLAIVEAGWQRNEIAALIGVPRQTVGARVQAAQDLLGGCHPGLLVDAPLDKPPDTRAVLQLPVDDREWLTRREAATLVGCHPFTIRNWLAAGLLPNTDRTRRPHLVLRADLLRVARGPRYNRHGVDYAAVRAELDNAQA